MNLFNPQPAAAPQKRQAAAKATETPDRVLKRLINEHFAEKCSSDRCKCDTPECAGVQKVINRMGPAWYAEGIRRIEAGADTAEKLFQGTMWKLKP
jgi:hypothetical protein